MNSARDVAIDATPIMSWAEVKLQHFTRLGIYHRDGRLISLLTDLGTYNSCYPDALDPASATMLYTGEGRRGDQGLTPGNRALLDAIESGHSVPVFLKLGVGRWQHTGFWRVTAAAHRFDEEQNRMLWQFTLQRVSGGQ